MMVQTLNPYSPASKTEEILSRYRPIAPKPEITTTPCDGSVPGCGPDSSSNTSCSSSSPHKIRHSPYLRNIWANLQARPTRTRKRGRSGISPATLKRHNHQYHHHPQIPQHQNTVINTTQMAPSSPHLIGISCPSPLGSAAAGAHPHHQHQTVSFQGFLSPPPPPPPPPMTCRARGGDGGLMEKSVKGREAAQSSRIVTLPLLSCPSSSSSTITLQPPPPLQLSEPTNFTPCHHHPDNEGTLFDLNTSDHNTLIDEKDVDLKLQLKSPTTTTNVISPQPIRPIGSTITVGPTNSSASSTAHWRTNNINTCLKKTEEVEQEVEAECLPMVISDSSHKVRMVNSAYKELVGQPECGWLDYVTTGNNRNNNGKRISGEVMLQVSDDDYQMIVDESNGGGFSCWARIEWDDDDDGSGYGKKMMKKKKKSGVSAYCDVSRLYCESKRYLFSWRFHTGEVSPSRSSV